MIHKCPEEMEAFNCHKNLEVKFQNPRIKAYLNKDIKFKKI